MNCTANFRKNIVSALLGVLLIVFPIVAILPTAAAAAPCCSCKIDNKDICLTDAPNGDCGAIATGPNSELKGVQCTKLDDESCKPIAEKGRCEGVVMSALTYKKGAVKKTYVPTVPKLGVYIPGLEFSSEVIEEGGRVKIPFFAQYIAAIYKYLLGISLIVASIMLVYGGMLYVAGGTFPSISRGKDIIIDALVGLALLLGVVTIFQVINPEINALRSVSVLSIEGKTLAESQADVAAAANAQGVNLQIASPPAGQATGAQTPPTQATAGLASKRFIPPENTNTSENCSSAKTTKLVSFDWIPNGQSASVYLPGKSKILVPGPALKCPGKYPVILWLHGNNGPGQTPGAVGHFMNVLDNLVNTGVSQPVIIVVPASKGDHDKLFPGMSLTALKDAALATLKKSPETSSIEFSSVSVGGHSAAGCTRLWPTVDEVQPYAVLNADTCFGIKEEAQHPQKMIVLVTEEQSNYYFNISDGKEGFKPEPSYMIAASKFGMVDSPGQCTSDFALITGAAPNKRKPNCLKTPGKDWTMLFVAGERKSAHEKAPSQSLEYALRKFFPATAK